MNKPIKRQTIIKEMRAEGKRLTKNWKEANGLTKMGKQTKGKNTNEERQPDVQKYEETNEKA